MLPQCVVRVDDNLGQQKVNKAAPERPRTRQLIGSTARCGQLARGTTRARQPLLIPRSQVRDLPGPWHTRRHERTRTTGPEHPRRPEIASAHQQSPRSPGSHRARSSPQSSGRRAAQGPRSLGPGQRAGSINGRRTRAAGLDFGALGPSDRTPRAPLRSNRLLRAAVAGTGLFLLERYMLTQASTRRLASSSGDQAELPVDPRVDVVLGDGCGHPLDAAATVVAF